jgi:hypothetical protein
MVGERHGAIRLLSDKEHGRLNYGYTFFTQPAGISETRAKYFQASYSLQDFDAPPLLTNSSCILDFLH